MIDWAPMVVGSEEMLVARVSVAALSVKMLLREDLSYGAQPHATGLARFADLAFLTRDPWLPRLRGLTVAAAILYASGWLLPLSTALLAFSVLAIGSVANSQGGSGHSQQGLALVLVASLLALLCGEAGQPSTQRTAFLWSQQALIAVYFTAGLTKLVRTQGTWILRAANAPLQVVKCAEVRFHEKGDARTRDWRLACARWLASHRLVLGLAAAGVLALELGSPLLLTSSGAAVLGGILLIAFHQANAVLLGLAFREHQVLVFALFIAPSLVG